MNPVSSTNDAASNTTPSEPDTILLQMQEVSRCS